MSQSPEPVEWVPARFMTWIRALNQSDVPHNQRSAMIGAALTGNAGTGRNCILTDRVVQQYVAGMRLRSIEGHLKKVKGTWFGRTDPVRYKSGKRLSERWQLQVPQPVGPDRNSDSTWPQDLTDLTATSEREIGPVDTSIVDASLVSAAASPLDDEELVSQIAEEHGWSRPDAEKAVRRCIAEHNPWKPAAYVPKVIRSNLAKYAPTLSPPAIAEVHDEEYRNRSADPAHVARARAEGRRKAEASRSKHAEPQSA